MSRHVVIIGACVIFGVCAVSALAEPTCTKAQCIAPVGAIQMKDADDSDSGERVDYRVGAMLLVILTVATAVLYKMVTVLSVGRWFEAAFVGISSVFTLLLVARLFVLSFFPTFAETTIRDCGIMFVFALVVEIAAVLTAPVFLESGGEEARPPV